MRPWQFRTDMQTGQGLTTRNSIIGALIIKIKTGTHKYPEV